jgi:hypothetical protein
MLDPAALRANVDDQRALTMALVEASPAFQQHAPLPRDPADAHVFYAGAAGDVPVRSSPLLPPPGPWCVPRCHRICHVPLR